MTVNSTIAGLPDLSGYGTVTSLQQAMQEDGSGKLAGYVENFFAATNDTTRNTLVDEILFQWAGISSYSTITYVNGAVFYSVNEANDTANLPFLPVLEKFSGQTFIDPYNGTSTPSIQAAAVLAVAYLQLHDMVLAGLEAQTDLQSLFNGIQMTYDSTSGSYYGNFTAATSLILADLSSNRASALTTLTDFNNALDAEGLDTGEGYAAFRTSLITQGSDVAATFLYGAPIIDGDAGDDNITLWAGNQTVYAGNGNMGRYNDFLAWIETHAGQDFQFRQ